MNAVKRYLDLENQSPYYYEPLINKNIETVRRRLAAESGCDPEEMAITRNASESLQIAQSGLDLAYGDEVITTEQDHPRMLMTWDPRLRCACPSGTPRYLHPNRLSPRPSAFGGQQLLNLPSPGFHKI